MHRTNLGSFLPQGLRIDLNGYVPLPGDKVSDFVWEDEEWAETMAEGEEWNGETWTSICAENGQLVDGACEALSEWAAR